MTFGQRLFFAFFLVSERRQVVGSTRRGKGAVLALSSTPRKKPKRLQRVLAFWAKYSEGKKPPNVAVSEYKLCS